MAGTGLQFIYRLLTTAVGGGGRNVDHSRRKKGVLLIPHFLVWEKRR